MTPELGEGPVELTAMSHGTTSTAPIVFTYTKYEPPLVKITDRADVPVFSQNKLLDRYAGIFDPGNVYLQIENTFPTPVRIFGPTGGRINLGPGETAGYNLPVQGAKYVFDLEESTAKTQKLKLKTKMPL